MSTNEDDRPYWDIDALLVWIGRGKAGVAEIEREAGSGRLTMTGCWYGAFDDAFFQRGREAIPATAFADDVISRLQGRWVLARDPKRWMQFSGWRDLMVRSDEARELWPREDEVRPQPEAAPPNPTDAAPALAPPNELPDDALPAAPQTMADEPPDTPFLRYFRERNRERIAAQRARQAADVAVEWLSYAQAVQLALPALFGADWVGLASEQEKVVLSLGPAHRDWRRYSELYSEREAQIARAERWLLVDGLVEQDRHGTRRVRAAVLCEALAERTAQTTTPASKHQIPRAAAHTMASAARRWLSETYPNGIPAGITSKMLAARYRKVIDGPMSARTMCRARQPART